MFDSPGPRLFGLPPGADFPALFVRGLLTRMDRQQPEAMARVTVYLNTARMRRRVERLLTDAGARLLPRLRLVTDLGADMPFAGIPAAVSALRRRLELTVLIDGLLKADPSLAPRSALYDLADSLAGLMDEMRGEGVAPEVVQALDVADHSAHWARAQAFLGIVAPWFGPDSTPDAEARQRLVIDRLIADWQHSPPTDPVIIAGSTGSRGTTALLMKAVAALPQGAIVLPGLDDTLPAAIWDGMSDALTAEDHPQYRFRRLMDLLGVPSTAVRLWDDTPPPAPGRNRLISLSLRPAPVTDQWLTEGRDLPDLPEATRDVTLIEAPTPRAEAMAIALILREAAENGEKAALISPDRNLTRRVAAALDRWGIRPDDSGGKPLALSPAGRFLRHVGALFGRRLTPDALLILLKHPLTFTGADRGHHLLRTRDLELHLRRYGPAFPDAAGLMAWAAARGPEDAAWMEAILSGLDGAAAVGARPLADHVAHHRRLAEALARGSAPAGAGNLWQNPDGESALAAMTELESVADAGGVLSPHDYHALFDGVLNRHEVREDTIPHPGILIWGTLEARVQGAGLVILGGLTEGVWPPAPDPDPWLNRDMRRKAGLLLPERRIGLSAHDYQQAAGAPRVVLSRALRDAEAETVPSRWMNRLTNLMAGLPDRHGPEALAAMRGRGRRWLDLAARLEAPDTAMPPARRPSPRPPVSARPDKLALTRISRLIRDPYAIYARYILRLTPLDPLRPGPDVRLRGTVLHKVLEQHVALRDQPGDPMDRLLDIAATVLQQEVAWPAAREVWLARVARAAPAILALDAQSDGTPLALETEGSVRVDPLPFTLFGRPDRIDLLPDGRLHLIDYKTGDPPSEKQQRTFDKQLLLAAAMAEQGGFADLGPREVARITFQGLGPEAKVVETDITPALTAALWADLQRLIGRYLTRAQGYTSRRAMFETNFPGEYDHLARLGEWDLTDAPDPQDVGPEDVT